MDDVAVIDRFLGVFSTYIDSGFGLLGGEIAFLTATLIVIDMTLAGLYWAMSHATGQGDDVIAKLLRKVLYVGAFAYILSNFNLLAGIVFRSFAGLGLMASGSTISETEFLQPGRLAKVGIDAAEPIMEQIGDMTGFPGVFVNLDAIMVLFLAWLVVILTFFILAVQLFITLIEFKLTTLAGFVLVPFALWNKTSFLAEKVLGNVVSAGIKVLVLAVIVGIGTGLFPALMPKTYRDTTSVTGIELDPVTARIVSLLQPKARIITGDFVRTDLTPIYDLAIVNPAFFDRTVGSDRNYRSLGLRLHDYFIEAQLSADLDNETVAAAA